MCFPHLEIIFFASWFDNARPHCSIILIWSLVSLPFVFFLVFLALMPIAIILSVKIESVTCVLSVTKKSLH